MRNLFNLDDSYELIKPIVEDKYWLTLTLATGLFISTMPYFCKSEIPVKNERKEFRLMSLESNVKGYYWPGN